MKKGLMFLMAAVACVGLALHGEELQGVDTWAGIKPLPAVVNPVGREASPDVISLRGEWEFVTQPKAFCRRYRHTKTPFAKVDEQIRPALARGLQHEGDIRMGVGKDGGFHRKLLCFGII